MAGSWRCSWSANWYTSRARGALPLTAGGAVIVDAHLYGAVGGALAALLLRVFTKPV